MSSTLFISANVAIGLALLAAAVWLCRRLARRARTSGRPAPRLVWAAAAVGVLVMEAGVARTLVRWRPFDPAATPLRMTCHRQGPPGVEGGGDIPFAYDPQRRCVNDRTYYASVDGGLARVILRRHGHARAPEVDQLFYRPDFAHPRAAGVFIRRATPLTPDAWTALAPLEADAAQCPDAGDVEAAARADRAVTDLLRRARALPDTGAEEARWRCVPE